MKNMKPLIVLMAAVSISMASIAQKHQQHKDPILSHSKELQLSADQSARLNRLKLNRDAEIKSLRRNDGLSQAEKQERMKSLHMKYRDSSFAVLTQDQLAQMQSLRHDSTHRQRPDMQQRDLGRALNLSQEQSEKLHTMQ